MFTFVLLRGYAHARRDIPDDNLAYPVLLISGIEGGKIYSGSGFYYIEGEALYFITARHNLFKETSEIVTGRFVIPKALRHKIALEKSKEKGKFHMSFYGVMSESERDEFKAVQESDSDKKIIDKLYKESQKLKLRMTSASLFSYPRDIGKDEINKCDLKLTKLYENGKIKYHNSSDVAVVLIGTFGKDGHLVYAIDGVELRGSGILGVGKDGYKLFNDVLISNTIYTFGYPTSISQINPFLDVKLPLLRKGTVAGKNKKLEIIILDCPVYKGNSGGIVIEVETVSAFEKKLKAIGLVTNLVPNPTDLQNSGYSVAVPMDRVIETVQDFDQH
jgi:hypothetical protein